MSHVCFAVMSGFRVREAELAVLGMSLPGLTDRANAIGQLPALGVLTLAGMLPEDWTCSYVPVKAVSDEIIQQIVSQQPDLVAISALTASIGEAVLLSRRLRSEGIQTVIGGLHATAVPETLTSDFDAVVAGAGEPVWLGVVGAAANRALQPIYRSSTVRQTVWPTPRFDLLPEEAQRMTVQTVRGCPLACEFCGASRLLGRFSEKPLEQLGSELEILTRLHRRPLVELADDNTFAGHRDHMRFLEIMQQSGVRWFTEADWRIGENAEVVNRLAAAGCRQILIGIESLCFQYPGMGGKQADMDRILAACDAIQSSGVAVNACFVIGANGETRQSIDRLVRFLHQSSFAEVQLTLQTPFPGTELYRRLSFEQRILTDRDWSHYTLFDVTYHPDCLSVNELEAAYRDAVRSVFCQQENSRRQLLRREIHRISMNRRQ
ncbi:MAG: cobalamin-dependent protein [Planctomycetaceae bacterium]